MWVVARNLENQAHEQSPDQSKKYEPSQQIDQAASCPCVNDQPDCIDVGQQSENANGPKHRAIFRRLSPSASVQDHFLDHSFSKRAKTMQRLNWNRACR